MSRRTMTTTRTDIRFPWDNPIYNTESDIISTNSRYTVICVPSHPYQHDTIIQNNQQHHPIVRSCLDCWGNGWARTRQQIPQVGWHNETSSSLTNIPIIIIVSSYVPAQSYITINNSRRRRMRVAKSAIDCCTVLIVRRLYGSHWTIHYSSHPTYNTDSNMTSSQMVVTLSSVYQVIIPTY